MAKALSIQSVIEANRLSSDVPFLCLIDVEVVDPDTGVVVTVLNFVHNTEPILFQGTNYAAASFDISIKQESGKQAEASLGIKDLTQTIQGYMEAYGGGIGFNLTVYVVNGARLFEAPEVVEYFQITGATSGDYAHSFTLGAENILAVTFPRRRQTRDFCQNRYKSVECGYTGVLDSCDLSLKGPNGCQAHNNDSNFLAFPGLNSNGYRYD